MRKPSVRIERFQREIQQIAADFISAELRPFLKTMVTIQRVEMPPDLKSARVLVSFYGLEADIAADLDLVAGSCQELQRSIGRRLQTKYTPKISFVRDRGLEHLFFVENRLKEIKASQAGQEIAE